MSISSSECNAKTCISCSSFNEIGSDTECFKGGQNDIKPMVGNSSDDRLTGKMMIQMLNVMLPAQGIRHLLVNLRITKLQQVHCMC